jgi:hypothetical protein
VFGRLALALFFSHGPRTSNAAGFLVALQAHVDVLAHTVEDTRAWKPSYIPQMMGQGMWLIPTLRLFKGDSNWNDILREVSDYSPANNQILLGTDVGFLPD